MFNTLLINWLSCVVITLQVALTCTYVMEFEDNHLTTIIQGCYDPAVVNNSQPYKVATILKVPCRYVYSFAYSCNYICVGIRLSHLKTISTDDI